MEQRLYRSVSIANGGRLIKREVRDSKVDRVTATRTKYRNTTAELGADGGRVGTGRECGRDEEPKKSGSLRSLFAPEHKASR